MRTKTLPVFKFFCALLAVMIFLPVIFSGCEDFTEPLLITNDISFQYYSFTDIPGVTDEEIRDIEILRNKYEFFNYGVNESTEAFLNKNGEINGFASLFCEWLTGLFQIRFEPKLYEWEDLIDGLKSGEIDFTGELTATESRRRTYIMTDAIAERTIKLMRLEESMSLMEIAEIRPLRYAFLTGTVTVDDVIATVHEKFEPFYVSNYEDAYDLLSRKRVDAFLDEGTAEAAFDIYGDVTASDFFPLIYSPVSLSAYNPEFTPVISVIQKALENDALKYLTGIYNQGHSEYVRHKFQLKLSETEQEYLNNNKTVRFAAEYDNYPISFYNEHYKNWQGIAFDIIAELETFTGLSFELVNDRDAEWTVLQNILENGEASMITELLHSNEREGRFIWSKVPILTDHYALLSKAEHRNINVNEILYTKIGLIKDVGYTDLFKSWFPNHRNIIEYESTEAALDALINGGIDMVMSTQNQLLMLTSYYELSGYKANFVFDQSFNSVFGFNKNDGILCSVIDKALELIDRNGIANQWTRKTYDYRAKLAQSRLPWLIGAASLLMLVLILLFIMFQRNRFEGKRLEKLVHSRTLELEEASAAKSVFLANMSHEIRTPMNAIIGMTTIGKSATDEERKDYCFVKIEDASQHLLGIINDILDMSKIEANKFELSYDDFSFEKMLQRVVNVVNFKIDEKHQKFTVHIDMKMPKILHGDDQRLAQVITNLLGNSVKFTPDGGGISLNAQFLGEDENGMCEIKVKVTDTGIGISPEQQKRLFTSFQQAESSTTRKFGGSGLGLSISKNIVEMMGGRIWIESELGKGSDFIFTVKMKRGEEPKENREETGSNNINWKNVRILAVDDDPDILDYFKEIMQQFGALCDTASSGGETLELIKKNGAYDIYFIDWNMPGMNGIELTSILRSEKETETPGNLNSVVIMISATEWGSIENEAKKAGVNKFLPKPLFPSSVFDAVSESLGVSRSQPEKNAPDIDGIFKGYSILLAEDVEINREIVLTLLEPTLLDIDCAENGAEAVRMFKENPEKYDMIFMDIQMPVMDGYEATKQIRGLDTARANTVHIVAMTANVFREDIEKSREAGMNDHIGKPLDFDEVLVKLHAHLLQKK